MNAYARGLLRALTLAGAAGLAACSAPGADVGIDSHPLTELKAEIWTDPNGCQHWFIDDGVEGYLTARRARDGKPVCPGRSPDAPSAAGGLPRVQMNASIWVDERGCQHWFIDDGLKGFLSERLDRSGKPVCKG